MAAQEVERLTGLHFPLERSSDIERGLKRLRTRFNLNNLHEALDVLRQGGPASEAQSTEIATCFTIGETHFYRDHFVFDRLTTWFLNWAADPGNQDSKLRIWCAACSTGEEAYTLAALVSKCFTPAQQKRIEILATDINVDSLARARKGVYSKWSFRDVPKSFRELNFTRVNEQEWEVKPRLKALVNFKRFNLVTDLCPAEPYELILCRNVVMYFTTETAQKVVKKLLASLHQKGLFFVAAAEAWLVEGCEHLDWGAGVFQKPQTPETLLEKLEIPGLAFSEEDGTSEPDSVSMGDDFDVQWAQAQESADKGQLEISLRLCTEILSRAPHSLEVYRLKARVEDSLGLLGAAATSLHQALYLSPASYSDRFLLGSVLERAGNPQGALATYRAALNLLDQGAKGEDESAKDWVRNSLENSIERLRNG